MKKMSKIIIALALLALAVSGGYYYVFVYSKNHHRNIQSEKSVSIQADSLSVQYQSDEAKANILYLNKVLRITGTILSIGKDQTGKITLMMGKADAFSNVSVTLTQTNPIQQKVGDTISIKGVCTGALSDVVITDAVIE
jgi:flagellar basal body-associated protein FliL